MQKDDFVAEAIEYALTRRELLIEAFVAETGLLPSQCVLCEQIGTPTRFWIEAKEGETPHPFLCGGTNEKDWK
jgi:hypothetical protein